ncbi:hypothetical protein SAMN06297129_1607 [Pseudooceanicola antarcticus]|uniref:Uncharacterized protein n=1 Tax=Pseudooceanicola antarcticus TaxID=1247613 RepID=A0A285IPB0_9RHOB|nr:hypothetical protein [Pseudooceanicola antarcticus]PJE31478.1 hypothetical protein CVM39_03770 [Pseudooceanicola antarcticus]SNY49812.1 hypothetical protein SAMN06297129_1607 [Pseudooceanicola antarcticus]
MEPFSLLSVGMIIAADFDKQLHLMAGMAIHVAAQELELTPLEACLLSFGAGLAKEAWDSRGHGNVEFEDLAATAFGCQVTIRF